MQPPPRTPPIPMLVGVSALGPLALNILMPAMPMIRRSLETDTASVQLTLSLYLVGLAVSQLLYGPLSDRFGRRPLMLVGLVLFLAGTLGGLFAPTIEVLVLSRMVQAIGGCAGIVLGRAMVRDLFSRERSASVIAYMTMMMVVAPMLAPLIGGYLSGWFDWRATFAFTAAIAALVTLAGWRLLHETHFDRQALPGIAGMARSYDSLFRMPAFRAYAMVLSFSSAGFFAFLGGAPHVVVDLMGRSPSDYGVYSILGALGYMIGNFFAGRFSTRFGVDRMIGFGAFVSFTGAMLMLSLALAGLMTHPILLFLPLAVYAMGNGLTLPNGMAGAISANPRAAGAASGLAGFLQMTIGALASVAVGYLVAESATPMIVVMAGASLLAILAWTNVRRVSRRQLDNAAYAAE